MKSSFQASRKERFFYGTYFFGQNIIWSFVGLVSTFLLDIGLDATVASAILLAPKVWDAINDTLFGVIVDRTRFKNNQKFMPWIKLGTAFLGITVILLFAIPASIKNPSFKIAWFVVAYILFDTAYTMLDAPMYAMPTAMTTNIQERTSLLSVNRFWGIFGALLATVLIPVIRPKTGWLGGAVIFVVFGLLFMVPFLFLGHERNTANNEDQKKEYSLKEMWNYVKTNKYLTISLLMLFIVGACSVEVQLSLIMARNCLGNETLATILGITMSIPMVFIAFIVPLLTRRINKYTLVLAGMVVSFAASVILFIVGFSNFSLILILMTIKGIGCSFFMIMSYMFIADSVEYGTYKTGTRAPGISFSLQSFVSKLKSAVIGSLALFALGLFGYDSTLPETVIQSQTVVNSIWTVYTLLPAIGYVCCIVMLAGFYKLRDKDVEVMAKYNNGEITKVEAEEVLSARYGAAGHGER